MQNREFSLTLRLRLPRVQLGKITRRLLPTPGNVIFTVVMIALLVAAQSVGALPLGRPLAAPSATSTGTVAYQGRLADSAGAPLTGTYNMIFRLYDAATGGTPLWSEPWDGPNSVRVSDGLFNVMLGSLTPIPQAVIAGHDQLFLGITVGTDDEMAPRVQLGSVPYATQALTVPDGSVTTGKIADGAITEAKLTSPVPRLLGHKTCNNCGNPKEYGIGDAYYFVRGATVGDTIEVSKATHGRPIMAHVTVRFNLDQPQEHYYCVIQVAELQRLVHVAGHATVSDRNVACSGSYLFDDLPAGTYTFRALVYFGSPAAVTWVAERQIAIYEF